MESGAKDLRAFAPLVFAALLLAAVAVAGWIVVELGGVGSIEPWAGIIAFVITAVALGYFFRTLTPIRRGLNQPANDPVVKVESEAETAARRFLDDLTGLPARFWFDQSFRTEIARSLRYHRPLSIVIIDIDDFARINQKHGRASGDYVLVTIADLLRKSVRQTDQLARLAGDEFAIVVPETDESGAMTVGEKIRRAIELYPFDEHLEVTVSVGVTAVAGTDTVGGCLERGETAVMTVRRKGGNGVATSAT